MLRMVLLSFLLVANAAMANGNLQELSDEDLREVTGQALLVSDRIAASSINNAPAVDNGLTFYRMGLDATMAFNLNIAKLQLGCGGINNGIEVGCDIDATNVSFMGNNCPTTGTCSNPGPGNAVTSDFSLTRPYLEVAVSGDGTVNRQVAGIAIGAQSANGYLSVGRTYSSGQVNQETGKTCTGGNDPQCQSGFASFSGYLSANLNGNLSACATLLGVCVVPVTAPLNQTPATITGTRITSGYVSATLPVTASVLGIPITLDLTANLSEPLSYIHGASLVDTPDFFLSFQRQQIAYPSYDKTTFEPTANTGWWLSAPANVEFTGISASGISIPVDLATIGQVFSGGVQLNDVNLNQTPAQNCYGTARFC